MPMKSRAHQIKKIAEKKKIKKWHGLSRAPLFSRTSKVNELAGGI